MDLFKISLSCSLVGIFIVLLLAETLDASIIEIKDINQRLLERNVKIVGTINSVYEGSDMLIINVEDGSGEIKVVLFNKGDFSLSKGDNIEIDGKVTEYEGELEINANSVEVK